MNPWPFDQSPDVAALTTKQVLDDGLPILTVIHFSDDHSWAFLCGSTSDSRDGRLIGMAEALKIDPTLSGVADLKPGYVACRGAIGAPWRRGAHVEA